MKSKILLVMMIMLLAMAIKAQPPNNAIFFGSSGDGFVKLSNNSLSNAIFSGGPGDGFGVGSNGAVSNNVFAGGFGDGWNYASNGTLSNTIFIGGIGDGWNYASNGSVSNSIFVGGIGDGWIKAANASASNDIFLGGEGDGWASQYRPMGPLPVHFLYFYARKQGNTAGFLSWKTARENNASHYEVERSTDAVNFSYIGSVSASGNTSGESNYSFTDHAPAKGFNYYRLKQVDIDGRSIYTVARVLNFDDLDAGMVKYYPNPTSGILNIELTEQMRTVEKWVTISNTGGIVVDHFKIQANHNILVNVNLGKYPKGIYFIQIKATCCNSTQRIVVQ